MTPDDFFSESQAENARKQREFADRHYLSGAPTPTAAIEHPISRRVEQLPGGGEKVTVTLGRVQYYRVEQPPSPEQNPPEDAA